MPEAVLVRVIDETPGAPTKPRATLRIASEKVSVRELIRQRVEAEVNAFNAGGDDTFDGLVQPSDSARSARGYKLRQARQLDAEAQVRIAWQAFERNGFVMLFDDRQVEQLDDEVALTGFSTVTFVRLMPLVGG